MGPEITLAVVNATIWTGERDRKRANALAVAGDRIAAVGTSGELHLLIEGAKRRIDAQGRFVVPGFIDSHLHLIEGGLRLRQIELRSAASREEFVARIRDFAARTKPGSWITGGDWDHERWGGQLPDRSWIDPVTPEHPVWVNRLDGHMGLANSLALKLAGISRATADVEGGTIVRDAAGEPTGLLKDNAMALIRRAIPEPETAELEQALEAAMQRLAACGITSVHHMGSWRDLGVFRRARQAGRLKTRIYAATPLGEWERLAEEVRRNGRGDEWLRIGALKGFADGSLGSRTAAFLRPYADNPRDSGLLVNAPERLWEWISGADRAGLHVMIHAIGDRANRLVLDLYERLERERGRRQRRLRIEHAQHLSAADVPRFGKLGVIASVQPYHAIDDGRWAERAVGHERLRDCYPFRRLLQTGAVLAFGSDWFVAPASPLEGIYAAVTRRTIDGAHPEGWVPEEKITVEEALTAYTRSAAFASFEEEVKGSLAAGKLADFVLLERDLRRVPAEEIREVPVRLTVVGGQVIYEAL
jgi:predicted amidohydrolase YtcJ